MKRREIGEIARFARESGGEAYAVEVMNREAETAVEALKEVRDSEVKVLLVKLTELAIARVK